MSTTNGPCLADPAPAAPGRGCAEAVRLPVRSRAPNADAALAELRLTQIRALQQRFRDDLQSVCSLASLYGCRADGTVSVASFKVVSQRATALAALYDELLRGDGAESVGFASYLGRLCARLALAELRGRALILHVEGDNDAQDATPGMDGAAASALGTVVAELVAVVARYGPGDVTVDLLFPDGRGRGRLTVSMAAVQGGPPPGEERDLRLARSLVAQAGGKLDRLVACAGVGWCVRF